MKRRVLGVVASLASILALTAGGAMASVPPGQAQPAAVAPPQITETLGANTLAAGMNDTIWFKITNPNLTGALTGVAFTDVLPLGLQPPSNVFAGACGGLLSVVKGASASVHSSITFTGGSIVHATPCVMSATVTVLRAGSFTNKTAAVTASNSTLGAGNQGIATITAVAPPALAAVFAPASIKVGGTSALTFTIANNAADTIALAGVGFTDTLPAGLTVVSGKTSICGGTLTLTAPSGIALSGATIPVKGKCTILVTVKSTKTGTFTTTTGFPKGTYTDAGSKASANLSVVAAPVATPTPAPTPTVAPTASAAPSVQATPAPSILAATPQPSPTIAAVGGGSSDGGPSTPLLLLLVVAALAVVGAAVAFVALRRRRGGISGLPPAA